MIPLIVYKYILIALILICCFLMFKTFRGINQKFELKVGTLWMLALFIINLINIYYTLNYYDKNRGKKGPKGPKGLIGNRGFKGDDFECSQCGNAGKAMEDVFATNVNDYNIIVNNAKVKIGKCVFPFVHDNEMIYEPTTKPREENEVNDAYKNGWCATSLNADRTYKTYGYANMSDVEAKRRQNEKVRGQKRLDYLKNNSGILDIKLITGNRSSIECPSGYSKIDKDLNEASGGKYLYLCKKEGLGGSGVQDMKTVSAADNYTCDEGYRKIPFDLNTDSGGQKIFLCHKKSNSKFITDIKVQNSSTCPAGYTNISGNVNAGSGGNEVYICTSNEPDVSVVAVDTAFQWGKDKRLYFFKGNQFWQYDKKNSKMGVNYPKNIQEFWGKIPSNLDAAFTWGFNNKTYFFKGALFYEYDEKRQAIAPGYPKYIKDVWKGVPTNIDSVFTWAKDGKTYFFKGKFYYKYDDRNNRVERGYPKYIERRFESEEPFNNMNAIFSHSDGKTYVIRGDKYWLLGNDDRVLSGYPRQLNDKFSGLY